MRLSDFVMKFLKEYGIKDIFLVSGGGSIFLDDSLNRSGINYYCCHHEQAVGFATESYARKKGKLGVSLVTSGPGGTNMITAVAGSWLDSVPHLILSGQVWKNQTIGKSKSRQIGMQEINIIDIIKPITKYATMVKDEKMIKYYLQKAIHLATTGRPGPVWLDIPTDIQKKEIDIHNLKEFKYPKKNSKVNKKQIKKIVKLLLTSKKPLIHIGQGVRISEGIDSFKRLVNDYRIPFITSRNANDIVSNDFKGYLGRTGVFGNMNANVTLQECDLYIAIGTSVCMAQTGYLTKDYARNAKKIMIDIDENSLNKPSLFMDMKVKCDARLFIDELYKQLEGRKLDINDWIKECEELKDKYPIVTKEQRNQKKNVNTYYFIERLSNRLDKSYTIVTDMGFAFQCTHQVFKVKDKQRFYTSSGLSAMGWGLPAAIGACIANNKKKVVCIVGDGGLQMNIQELATVMQYELPIKIFIFSNKGYLTMMQTFRDSCNNNLMGCNKETGISFPDFKKLSDTYDIDYKCIDSHKNIDKKIKDVLKSNGPVICEIIMDINQEQTPRVLSGYPLDKMYPYYNKGK